MRQYIKTTAGVVMCPDFKIERFRPLRGAELKLALLICSLSDNNYGTLELTSNTRKLIMKFFSITRSTLSGLILRLEEANVLKRTQEDVAMVNPDYMYNGTSAEYKHRKEVYEKIVLAIKTKNLLKTYLMMDGLTGYYKIGKSTKPVAREKTLQSEKPVIELLHVINDNIEAKLHTKFKSKRVRGEWFNLNKKDVEYILSIK